jgi:predicted AAA+ superfamily ATPase
MGDSGSTGGFDEERRDCGAARIQKATQFTFWPCQTFDSIRTRPLLPRAVVPAILKWMDDRQALVLIGSRQVGKTSILFLLIQHLLRQQVPSRNVFYLDLENFEHLTLLEEGPETLVRFFQLEGADFSQRIYLFIDEIQYLSNPSNFLKLMVDHYSVAQKGSVTVKVICTGSSTLDIRRKFKDSLVVRQFSELETRPDRGALVENFSFIHLYRNLAPVSELHYWRTKQGTEVDFVLQTPNGVVPIEVKYEAMRRGALPRGMQGFLAAYPTTQGAVVTKDHYDSINHHGTTIVFLPAWLLSTVSL